MTILIFAAGVILGWILREFSQTSITKTTKPLQEKLEEIRPEPISFIEPSIQKEKIDSAKSFDELYKDIN